MLRSVLRRFVLPLLLVAVASAGWAAPEARRTLSVSGEGRVVAVPDMAVITLGATAQAKRARDAMDRTSDATAAILSRLRSLGIAERDVQTTELSLNPVWSNRTSSSGEPRITGYQASNRVTVRVRDLGGLGGVLDAVLEDGANRLGGLRFTLQDPEPLMNEARRAAVADARARAELYAEAAGVKLGPLLSLDEQGGAMPRPEMLSLARAADAVPVAQGETALTARVHMVYEIVE